MAILSGFTAASESAWLRMVILGAVSLLAFSSRLFSVIRFESIIHEFDPWFNFRTTRQLINGGFYEFVNWFDQLSWYPLGRVVGGTVYPGIMITSGLIHYILNALHFPIDIREVCVFLAPLFSAFTAIATYLLTCEVKDSSAGLLAAVFIGVAPGYISRSVAGSYDNEGIAIFLLMITFYFWVKAVKTGSGFYGAITSLFYFYMVSAWGGYAFIINIIPLHVFALILMGRFSSKIYVSYTSFYVIGTLSSMQIPFVGFAPLKTSEHMAALGIFGLLQIMAFLELIRSHLSDQHFKVFFKSIVVWIFVLGLSGLIGLTMAGVISPWGGRFYSLFDTGYAKKYIPIIASVSEHQPTTWTSFFFDLQLLVPLFPAGVYFCFQELKNEHVFIIIYSVFASYFAGVMVRLMLTLTPVVCISAAIAMSKLLDVYLVKEVNGDGDISSSGATTSTTNADTSEKSSASTVSSSSETKPLKKSSTGSQENLTKPRKSSISSSTNVSSKKEGIWSADARIAVLVPIAMMLAQFAWHCTWVTSNAYSSPSVVLAGKNSDGSIKLIDDFREAYYWLHENTDPKARIMSWWDYGYQITGMANRTTLVDNNTWNNTHIATVGKAMASNEDVAYEVMQKHDVDYVLVIFGGLLGYAEDDINKFLWMIRIGQGVYPDDVKERDFFTARGEYRVDAEASPTMKNSLLYKTSYYRFNEFARIYGRAVDRARSVEIPDKPIKLTGVEEAFSSENLIVRIYQVKKPDNIGRSNNAAASFGGKRKRRKNRSSKKLNV